MEFKIAPFTFLLTLAVVFSVCLPSNAQAQSAKQGTLLLSPDGDCFLVFDGDSLGRFTANTVKKVSADFGDHILIATFDGEKTFKKVINVKTKKQLIISVSASEGNDGMLQAKKESGGRAIIDSENLTVEKATELYKAELLKPSPVDIRKLKYYLSKGVDVHTTDVHGWSLLHEAAYQGDTDLIKFCLQNNLPIDSKSINSSSFTTPLSCAVEQNQSGSVQLLVRNKATYGMPDGYAELEYDSSNRYKGYFKDGKRDGKGIMYYRDGAIYEGSWAKDKSNGKGVYTLPDSSKYEGNFVDDEYSGQGTFTYGKYSKSSGNRYTGGFKKGRFSGLGHYYWANGGRYEGNFMDGGKNGIGTMYYANGDKYEGNWTNDKRSGSGAIYFADSNRYTGNWEYDAMSGAGTFHYTNGNRYEGNWKDNQKNGQGIFYYISGAKYVGNYLNGEISGQGTYHFASGDKYEGSFKNGKRNGEGTYHFVDGNVYVGAWVDGIKSGYGIMSIPADNLNFINHCKRCKTYKGYWEKDVKNGEGGCYDAKGELIFTGNFVSDFPIGDYPPR